MKQTFSQNTERQQSYRTPSRSEQASAVRVSIADHRASATQLRQLMAAIEHSPQAIAQRNRNDQFRSSPRMIAQRQHITAIMGGTLQKITGEEELIQGKCDMSQHEKALAKKTNNTGLSVNLKHGIENLSGLSMDHVEEHYNSSKPEQQAWREASGSIQSDLIGFQKVSGEEMLQGKFDAQPETAQLNALVHVPEAAIHVAQLKSNVSNNNMTVVQMGHYKGGRYVTDQEINYHDMYDKFIHTWSFSENAADGSYVDPTTKRKKVTAPVWKNLFDQLDQLVTQACTGGVMLTKNFHHFDSGTPVALKFAEVEKAGVNGTGGLLPVGMHGPGNIPMVDHPDEVAVTNFIGRAQNAYNGWLVNPILATRGPQDTTRLSVGQIEILSHRQLPPGWTFHISISGAWALHHAGPPNAQIDGKTGKPATFIYHT